MCFRVAALFLCPPAKFSSSLHSPTVFCEFTSKMVGGFLLLQARSCFLKFFQICRVFVAFSGPFSAYRNRKAHDLHRIFNGQSWDFLLYIGFKRAGKCLVCALLPQKLPLVCLTVCLVSDARRGECFRLFIACLGAKKKPVRCVAGRAFVLFVGAAALSWVMHSGQWASLFQSWQGSCRPCGRHPPRCSSPPRGPQPLPMSGSGQSADGRSDTGVRPESWSKR